MAGMKSLVVLIVVQMLISVEGKSITSCDDPCVGGACTFKDCKQSSSCRGGACKFINCVEPICQGGGCVFDDCKSPQCSGGGCDFINTRHTLKPGYCEGESCKLDGRPHPSMREGHVSL